MRHMDNFHARMRVFVIRPMGDDHKFGIGPFLHPRNGGENDRNFVHLYSGIERQEVVGRYCQSSARFTSVLKQGWGDDGCRHDLFPRATVACFPPSFASLLVRSVASCTCEINKIAEFTDLDRWYKYCLGHEASAHDNRYPDSYSKAQ